ncbi:MAG: choice-of-anchor X domain-containing protein, partial [Candidatus Micrarchaeota archaeon]
IGYNPATVQFSAASCAPICGPCDGICEDASCFTIDPDCDSTGNTTSGNPCPAGTCCAGTCTETCSINSDCDDSNACTIDTCTGGTGCDSSCQHTPIAACIDDDGCCPVGCTEETDTDCICAATCQGDVPGEACQEYECILGECTAVLKPDCCGNNMCEPPEETTITCPSDCLFTCGNNICDEDEDECNCPQDCGPCSQQCEKCTYKRCMPDGCICVGISNCCGNRLCEFGETFANCPDDCISGILIVKIISPEFGDTYARGSDVNMLARVFSGSRPVYNAIVTSSGFFGTTVLYDDGLHGDGEAGDGIYGSKIAIQSWVPYGPQIMNFLASQGNATGKQSSIVSVMNKLEFEMAVDKDVIDLGDTLSVYGSTDTEEEHMMQLTIISQSMNPIYRDQQNTTGQFAFTYHTSFLDPADIWTIVVMATDKQNNTHELSKTVEVFEPEPEEFLDLQYISPEPSAYMKGQAMSITVKITQSGEPITDAIAKTYGPRHDVIKLNEIGNGIYGGEYTITWDDPSGLWDVQTRAYKIVDDVLYGGAVSTTVGITETFISLDVSEPSGYQYSIGDTIPIRLKAEYANDKPADNLVIIARVDNHTVTLKQIEPSVYEGWMKVEPDMGGDAIILIFARDPYENVGIKQIPINIQGYSLLYYVERYWQIGSTLAIIFGGAGAYYLNRFIRSRRIGKFLKQKEQISEKQESIQKEYFVEHSMDKRTFKQLSQKYGDELKNIERELEKLEY